MPLVVTGSIGIDTVHTPTGSAESVLGGSCTYFAAAASFFTPVRLVAVVGEDFDNRHLQTLKAFDNIDLEGLEHREGGRTFRWTGRYLDGMNRRETVEVHLGVLDEDPPRVPKAFADSDYVFLANTDPANQLIFLERFPDASLVVCDTMDLWISTQRDNLQRLLDRVHGLVLNDAEAELLTENPNPVRAARMILDRHDLTFVIVKKGEHGAVLVHRDGIAALPAFPLDNVIDPTGAGDSFAGGLMGYLASTRQTGFEAIQRGLSYATTIASFTVESFSLDRLQRLTDAELQRRLIDFARIVRVV